MEWRCGVGAGCSMGPCQQWEVGGGCQLSLLLKESLPETLDLPCGPDHLADGYLFALLLPSQTVSAWESGTVSAGNSSSGHNTQRRAGPWAGERIHCCDMKVARSCVFTTCYHRAKALLTSRSIEDAAFLSAAEHQRFPSELETFPGPPRVPDSSWCPAKLPVPLHKGLGAQGLPDL